MEINVYMHYEFKWKKSNNHIVYNGLYEHYDPWHENIKLFLALLSSTTC
jgi:hypothetical protein